MWGAVIKDIAGALFDSLIGGLMDMYREWQLKKAEARAATLEAQNEARKQAREVLDSVRREVEAVEKPTSWDAFKQRGGVLLLLFGLLFAAGCTVREGYNVSEMPIIEVEGDPRPVLDTSNVPTTNEQLLMEYILKLEAAIRAYNSEARRLNDERGVD
jgi:hypothetical protein